MALLPISPGITQESAATTIGANLGDDDDAGGYRSRSMWEGRAVQFVRQYRFITAAQVATLRTFYDDNRTVTFTQVWKDGVTYTCSWVGEGHHFDVEVGSYWSGYMIMRLATPVV